MPLAKRSLTLLNGVHPDLVAVVTLAEQRVSALKTGLSMIIVDGVRTIERQRQLVATGASNTMESRHLTGHAVDLGAVVGGTYRGDWNLYFTLAECMQEAAGELGTPLRWGGVWDKLMADYPECGDEHMAYVARQRAKGIKRPFVDGPHFELPKGVYQ